MSHHHDPHQHSHHSHTHPHPHPHPYPHQAPPSQHMSHPSHPSHPPHSHSHSHFHSHTSPPYSSPTSPHYSSQSQPTYASQSRTPYDTAAQQHHVYMQQQAALAYQHNQQQHALNALYGAQSYTSSSHHASPVQSPAVSGTSTPTSALSPRSSSTPNSTSSSTTPTSTSTSTTVPPEGEKKSRISKACDSCRRRKRKCDGARPICGACARLSLPCAYPVSGKKRGPQAGVVKRLRQDLKTLESQVKIERTSTSKSARLSTPASALRISSILDTAEYRTKNDTYLKSYFELLNATMFPFLDQASFMEERVKYQQQEDLEQPLSWALRFGAVLAVGALMYGDRAHASAADRIAREAASNLFDQPSLDVIRGLHVLSFYCIGCNLQSRAACYLAVATRMTTILSGVGEEIQLMCNVLEDVCYSINWWYIGFDQTPETGFREPELPQTQEDREMYYKYMSVRGQTESEDGPPTGPNARAEMLRLMVLLSSHRGDFSRRPVGVWRMLLVLTKIEDSKYCAGPIRTLIRLQKAVTLRLLAHDPASHHEALLAANAAIEAAQTHDVTHCPFYCLLLHAAGQIHLAAGDSDPYIAVELDLLEKIAAKWDFVAPVLQNFQQRLARKLTSFPHHAPYQLPVAHFTPDAGLSSQDLKKAAQIFSTLTLPIPPANTSPTSTSTSSSSSQVSSPTSTTSPTQYPQTGATIDDTIASIHNQFKHSLNLEAQSDLAPFHNTTSVVHPTSAAYQQSYYQTYASYGYSQGNIRTSNTGIPPYEPTSEPTNATSHTTSPPMPSRSPDPYDYSYQQSYAQPPYYPSYSSQSSQHYPYPPSHSSRPPPQQPPPPTVALQSLHAEIAALAEPVSPSLHPLPIIPSSSSLPATDFLLSDIDKATSLSDPNVLATSFPSSLATRDPAFDFLAASPPIDTSLTRATDTTSKSDVIDLSITPMSVPSALVSAFNEAQTKSSTSISPATSTTTSTSTSTATTSTAHTSTSTNTTTTTTTTITSTSTSASSAAATSATSPSLTPFQQAAQQRQQQQATSPTSGLSQQLQQQRASTQTSTTISTWTTPTPPSPYQHPPTPYHTIPSFTRPTSTSVYPSTSQHETYESPTALALAQAKQRTDSIKQHSKPSETKPIIPGSHVPSSVLSTYTNMSYQQRPIVPMGPPQMKPYTSSSQQQQQQHQSLQPQPTSSQPQPTHEPITVLPASVDMQQATPMSADTAMVADFLITPGSGVGSLLGPVGMSGMSASPAGDMLLQKTTAFEHGYFG